MKLSMVRHTILTSFLSSRMFSSMSSRSVWNSCCNSSISDCVCLCLFHNFSSFAVIFSTCSSVEAYVCSRVIFSDICCSSSSFIRCSSRLRSSTSICALLSSFSCCMAFSMTWLPTSIFSSIIFSCCIICAWASCSSSFFLWRSSSSSSNRARSSSATSFMASIWACSSRQRCSSARRSASTLASMAARSWSVISPCTTRSMTTSFSTTRSTSTTCVSTMTSCSPCSPPAPGARGTPPPPPAFSANFILSRVISSWNSRIIASFGSSLIFGLFLMLFAR
mmetsp:Transcript_53311/g.161905  ORF Transcript_53311/g.161905 Transcript_53311/m.161905 type:complete len:279 (-) Transcript_53311:1051-1887(-)